MKPTGRKVGRPSVGTRMRLNLRLPVSLYARISAAAVAADLSVNTWIVAALAAHLEEPR